MVIIAPMLVNIRRVIICFMFVFVCILGYYVRDAMY